MIYTKQEHTVGIIGAFIVGILISAVLISIVYKLNLHNCESDLPRDQSCKLIAVPETISKQKIK